MRFFFIYRSQSLFCGIKEAANKRFKEKFTTRSCRNVVKSIRWNCGMNTKESQCKQWSIMHLLFGVLFLIFQQNFSTAILSRIRLETRLEFSQHSVLFVEVKLAELRKKEDSRKLFQYFDKMNANEWWCKKKAICTWKMQVTLYSN